MRRASFAVCAFLASSLAVPSVYAQVGGARPPVKGTAAEGASFAPSASLDLGALTSLVVRTSPAVQADLLNVDLALADVDQAHLLGNPQLDAAWGTIPIGETNPSNLGSPLANVPNYSVGLSYTFPLGKRGPRQRRAAAAAMAAGFTARAAAKHQALDLATVLGQLATNQLRLEGMRGLATEERATLGLARTRLAAGFSTPLDVDRMEIELFRVEQQGVAAEAEMAGILARCTAVVRTRCTAFPNSSDARTFLTSWVSRTLAQDGPPEQRAELRALDASRVAAEADIDLAKAQAIPDPTVRLGYMHDRFVASGNQQNSVNLSVSLPLTFFDHGQALRRAAEARVSRLDAVRTALVRTAPARVGALRDALVAQQQRQSAIDTQILPRARSVVTDLQRAADNRLIPLIDVINARRTLSELLIQQADSYDDAFNVSIDLLAELPEPETSKKEPHP